MEIDESRGWVFISAKRTLNPKPDRRRYQWRISGMCRQREEPSGSGVAFRVLDDAGLRFGGLNPKP